MDSPTIYLLPVAASTEMVSSSCPGCGVQHNMAGSIDHAHLPRPGQPTLCAYCGHLCVFDDDLHLRNPTGREIWEFQLDTEFWQKMSELQRGFRAAIGTIVLSPKQGAPS